MALARLDFPLPELPRMMISREPRNRRASRPRNSCREKRPDRCDLLACKILRAVEFIVALQVDPELRRGPEVLRQPQRGVGGDAPPSVHDLVDPPRRNSGRDGVAGWRHGEPL